MENSHCSLTLRPKNKAHTNPPLTMVSPTQRTL
jgi:hypothetical protein